MKSVKVNKQELRSKLTDNLDKHVREYEEASKGYAEAVVEAARAVETIASKGADHSRIKAKAMELWQLPEPESHEEDYLRAIEMLEWEVEEEIELTQQEFQQYVQDNWGWKRDFLATTSNYLLNN